MRKIYLVPNLVTTANLFCGFYSIVASIHQQWSHAAWGIVVAGVCDSLDGRIARLAKATSQFGVEYDSLSDLVSFGLAPALLVYQWILEPFGRLGMSVAFLFVACSALRLARFNVYSEIQPQGFFQGLSVPMAASVFPTLILLLGEWGGEGWLKPSPGVMLGLTLLLAGLMVSNLQFPSFKDLNWRSKGSFRLLLMGLVLFLMLLVKPEVTLFLMSSLYIGVGVLWNGWRTLSDLVGRRGGPSGGVGQLAVQEKPGSSSQQK